MPKCAADCGASLVDGLHDACGAKQRGAQDEQQDGRCIKVGGVPAKDSCQSTDKSRQAKDREKPLHGSGQDENSKRSTSAPQPVDAAWLRTVLTYNPWTGELRWLVDAGARALAGQEAGHIAKTGYLTVRLAGRLYQAHRVIWLWMTGAWPRGQIDHRDRNRLNNAWSNLRDATPRMNVENIIAARADSSTGLRGVFVDKRTSPTRYGARIRAHGKAFHLGSYPSREEAYAAYIAAKHVLHGGWCPPAGGDLSKALRAVLPSSITERRVRADNKTGLVGVTQLGRRFQARVKGRRLGVFATPEAAAEAVRRARSEV